MRDLGLSVITTGAALALVTIVVVAFGIPAFGALDLEPRPMAGGALFLIAAGTAVWGLTYVRLVWRE